MKCELFQFEYVSISLAKQIRNRPVTCPVNSAKSQLSSSGQVLSLGTSDVVDGLFLLGVGRLPCAG